MISTHDIISAGALVVAVVAAALAGLLDPGQLRALSLEACLLIGVFASVAAVLLVQLWRVQGARTNGRRELPPLVRQLIYTAIFVAIGLSAFDNRKTRLLTDLPERTSLSLSRYCKPPRREAAPAPIITKVQKVRGCALILRAYKLGYTKKLGACAPKQIANKARAAAAGPAELCRDRLRDEPLLHYTWRVLADKKDGAAAVDPVAAVRNNLADFEKRLGYVSTLIDAQRTAITAAPHAAHHLWVNLPEPRQEPMLRRLFVPRKDCSDRFSDLDTRVRWASGDKATSALVEHALGQLLFDPYLGKPVGYCREYTIHWNAPADACARLAKNAAGFLDDSGALDSVRAVLQRHRVRDELNQLRRELGKKQLETLPDLRRLVSFQCLVVDPDGSGKLTHHEVRIDGNPIDSRELRVKTLSAVGPAQADLYRYLALVYTGIGYSGPVEQEHVAIAELGRQPAPLKDVLGTDFTLTRLELLHQSDPFLAGAPALADEQLIDVFPLRYHLQHLVDTFRRAYRRQRGRL